MKRILLLSAYDSASHRYWREGLVAALPEFDWVVKTLPARHFSWRVRTSGWRWTLDDDPDFDRPCDLVLATSLCGIAPLLAMRPALRGAPLWLYFHENQFAHPIAERPETAEGDGGTGREKRTIQAGWQFQSLQNAWCADWISFNSAHNRDTFLEGVTRMLDRAPEELPGDPVGRIESRSDVLPVPLTPEFRAWRDHSKEPGLIVWNHRWEWDKQPERFLRALVRLQKDGVPFRLAMMGSGGGKGGALARWHEALGDRVVHWGEADPESYRRWMQRADIGVSTARHDFQGLAMLELAQAGATVVAPRRVAYPEVLPDAVFYEGAADDADRDVEDLVGILGPLLRERADGEGRRVCAPPLEWGDLAARYEERIGVLLGGKS